MSKSISIANQVQNQSKKLRQEQLCACGCGKPATWNKWKNRWNAYLNGHNRKGKIVIFSEQHKQNISISRKGDNFRTGIKQTEKTILKRKIACFETISAKPRKGAYSLRWKELSARIKKRDHCKCIICDTKVTIKTHHIDMDKKNEEPLNLITICQKCHCIVHNSKNELKVKRINKIIQLYIINKGWL